MKQLFDYPQLKRDLVRYQEAIDLVPNERLKEKNQKIFNQLKAALRRIENGHDTSYSQHINPGMLRDTIIESVDLRRQLEKLVKDVKDL